MKEALLQYIWKQGLFDHRDLKTFKNEALSIIKPGEHNYDSGPDFSDARIKIGDTLWAGNIEIHVRSSEWKEHNHHLDPAYKNVVLHVVHVHDLKNRPDDNDIPVLELSERIDASLVDKYEDLMLSSLWIPCEQNLRHVREITRSLFMERLVIERLESRYKRIINTVSASRFDWHESFHQLLARSFGFHTNSDPFEKLAFITPLRLLSRHRNNLFEIESLLFGQSGLLNRKFFDEYPQAIRKEYEYQRKKYGLTPMNPGEWKFAKLRPVNFPTIRISQYANLVNKSDNLLSHITECNSIAEIAGFLDVSASGYWSEHYIHDKKAADAFRKNLGDISVSYIIINTIIPFIFSFGKYRQKQDYIDKALNFMEQIKPEKNKITRGFEMLKFRNINASDSQGLTHLKKFYCDEKQCLKCLIGNEILRSK